MNINNFISELKRRNVIRVAIAYAIAGWLIIQVISTIAPQFNFPDWVPPFVTIFVFCGFFISLIIAWAFEITPEGVKKSTQVDITKSVTARTGKKLNNLIITVLALAVVFLGVERIFFATSGMVEIDESKIGTASIAVLPFVNMSNDKDNEFFSDGLSEELLNVLAKVENMHVAGRTSSFKFKGHNENLTTIGNELKVDNILEGSVQKSENRIKITAQLIKVSDGYHLWSETYERELNAKNVFEIQEEISRTVLKELKIRLLPQEAEAIEAVEKRPTENIDAYNAYLEGNHLMYSTRIEEIEKAIEKYNDAISFDPKFAEAFARLAIAHQKRGDYGNVTLEETKAIVRKNIDQALLLNGNLGRAFDALGRFYLMTNEPELSLQTYERAVELLPNDGDVLDGYHLALEWNDQREEAERVQKKAYDMDPLNPDFAAHYANHISTKEPEKAMEIYSQLIKEYPDNSAAYFSKAHALSAAPYGDLKQAFELTYTAYNTNPNDLGHISSLFSIASDLNMLYLSNLLMEKAQRLYPKNESMKYMSMYHLLMEEKFDDASKLLNSEVSKFDPEYIDNIMTIIHFRNGDFNKAIALTEKLYPYLKMDTLKISKYSESTAARDFAILLKKSGNKSRFEYYKNALNQYMIESDSTSFDDPLDYDYIVLHNQLVNNAEQAADHYWELYFDKQNKVHAPSTLSMNIAYIELQNSPFGKKLKAKVFDDLDRMSKEAIDNLKAKGIWRQELEMDRVKIERSF